MRGLPRADLGVLALLAALPLLLLWPLVLLGRVLYFRDLTQTSFPEMAFFARSLAGGELPIWNPLLAGGYPQLASLSPPFFFPGLAPFFFLPFASAVTILVYANHALAGWSMYALGRYWRWSRPACLLAAILYAYGGFMVTASNMYLLQGVAAALPLVVLALERAWRRPNAWNLGLFAGLVGFHLAANRPDLALLEVVLCGCLLAARAWQERGAGWAMALHPVAPLALAAAWALALNAASLLPALEFIPNSNRHAGIPLAEAQMFALPPARLPALFFPDLFGDMEWGRDWGRFFVGEPNFRYYVLWIALYPGWAAWLLLPIAFWSRRRDTRWLAALLAASLLLAMGEAGGLYPFFHQYFPLASFMRFPVKWFLLASLCLAVLAGHGLDELLHRPRRYRAYLMLAAGAWGVAATGCLLLALDPRPWVVWLQGLDYRVWAGWEPDVDINTFMRQEWPAAFRAALFALEVGAGMAALTMLGLALAASRAPEIRRARSLPLLMAAAVDLIGQNAHFNFSAPAGYYATVPPVIQAMRDDPGGPVPFRFYRPGGAGAVLGGPRLLMRWQRGYSPFTPHLLQSEVAMRQQLSLYNAMAHGVAGAYHSYSLMPRYSVTQLLGGVQTARVDLPPERFATLAGALNIRYLLVPYVPTAYQAAPPLPGMSLAWQDRRAGVWLYRNNRVLPRAFFAGRGIAIAANAPAMARLLSPGFDPSREVVLALPADAPVAAGGGPARTTIEEYRNTYARVAVEARRAGYLVLTDNFYPGWRAYLDGSEVPLLRANLVVRAVAVPAGRHVVEFRYVPLSALAGAALSLLGWAVLAIGLVAARRRRHAAESAASVTIRS